MEPMVILQRTTYDNYDDSHDHDDNDNDDDNDDEQDKDDDFGESPPSQIQWLRLKQQVALCA